MKKIIHIVFLALCIASCSKKESRDYESQDTTASGFYEATATEEPDTTVHTDPDYKYEYRTGTSGDYEYNYDVNGSDGDGNSVYGNISISGKYGTGTIEDTDGNERDVDVEWIGYGVLEATDEEGNTYELEVDE